MTQHLATSRAAAKRPPGRPRKDAEDEDDEDDAQQGEEEDEEDDEEVKTITCKFSGDFTVNSFAMLLAMATPSTACREARAMACSVAAMQAKAASQSATAQNLLRACPAMV
jgi:hypothetical protein